MQGLENLIQQFKLKAGKEPEVIEQLPLSGSNRRYYRLQNGSTTAIGCLNDLVAENVAFVSFARCFNQLGVRVPEIYGFSEDQKSYLQEDLGATSLLDLLIKERVNDVIPEKVIGHYQSALSMLAKLQVKGHEQIDYSLSYPSGEFDCRSMKWDLNYFKYYFLKARDTPFDERLLDIDFDCLSNYLGQLKPVAFMFRDFQARNILVANNEVAFIDFQGGRQGHPLYDVVSILFQAKAALSAELRMSLLEHYLDALLVLRRDLSKDVLKKDFYFWALLRTLQVLGAYGFRGYFERKAHFLTSIPFALKNLKWLLEQIDWTGLPTLKMVLIDVLNNKNYMDSYPVANENSPLEVTISSFSYKKGLPHEESEHGGGFIFDCRSIHNPGRYEPYKVQSGKDETVKTFLETKSEMLSFLRDVFSIVDRAVENYLERDFDALSVHFGCTGGRHRSVYGAEALKTHLEKKYGVKINISHREKATWGIPY